VSGDVVVDTSLAISWVLTEAQSPLALALLRSWQQADVRILVPALFASEISSALLKRRRQGLITASQAQAGIATLLGNVTVRPIDTAIAGRALEIADGLGMWKAYDSLYLALAEREGCPYWTADERFFNVAAGQFPAVRWLGAYAPP